MRLAVIGAGSSSGAWLLYNLARKDELHGSTVILIDYDEEKLKIVTGLARRLNEEYDAKLEIVSSHELDVLEDTSYDYAVISVEKDRFRRWRIDYEVPEKYGIHQVLGESGGLGGLSHTLRTVPETIRIARRLEDINQYGRVFIYTNPTGRVTYAVKHYTGLRYIYGLCTGYLERRETLAQLLGVKPVEIGFLAAGLNHFTWIKELWLQNGEDAYPLLDEKLSSRPGWEPLLSMLYGIYGLYPSPSDNHVGEYIGWAWRLVPDEIKGLNWIERVEKKAAHVMDIVRGVATGELSPGEMQWISKYPDIAVDIIYAMETGQKKYQPAYNTVNNNAVPGLPNDIVVEIPGIITRRKIYPVHVSLSRQVIDLLQPQAHIQALSAQAAAEVDLSKAVKAIALDPTINDIVAALKAFKELLQIHSDILPQFGKEELDYIDKLIRIG